MLLAVAVGALLVRLFPGTNPLDKWGFDLVASSSAAPWRVIAALGSVPIVLAASLLGAVLARRDRRRAVACLLGPALAGLLTEIILKPLSGRELGGSLCFPSGHVTGAGALVALGLLGTPRRWRAVGLGIAVAVLVAVMWAVVALGWHYPTDALAGAAVGAGSVLFVDAGITALRRPWRRVSGSSSPRPGRRWRHRSLPAHRRPPSERGLHRPRRHLTSVVRRS